MREKSEEEVESLLLMEKGLVEEEKQRKEQKFAKITNKLFSDSLFKLGFFRKIYRWWRKKISQNIRELNEKICKIDRALKGKKEDIIEILSEIADRFYLAAALQERANLHFIPPMYYYHVLGLIKKELET